MHSNYTYFFSVLSTTLLLLDFVFFAPLRPRSPSALCCEEHPVAKHDTLPRLRGWKQRGGGKKKETERMHPKRTDVSRVHCNGNAKVYKPRGGKSTSHVDASTPDLPISRFQSQTVEFELRQIAVVSEVNASMVYRYA